MAESAARLRPGYPSGFGEPIRVYKQDNAARGMVVRILVWLLLIVPFGLIAFVLLSDLLHTRSPSEFLRILFLAGLILAFLAYFSMPLVRQLRLFRSQRNDVALLYQDGLAYFHEGTWSQVRWNEVIEVTALREPSTFDWNVWTGIFENVIDWIMAYLKGDTVRLEITTRTSETIRLGETLTGIDDLVAIILTSTQR